MSKATPTPTAKKVVNASEHPVEFWACDGERISLRPAEQRDVTIPAGCETVAAEQFGALYRAHIDRRPKASPLFTFIMGGTPQFPLAMSERSVVCFENKAEEPAFVRMPRRVERHMVHGRGSMDHNICFEGLTVDAIYKGVSPSYGDVRGTATVKESGLWVTSGHLRYEILS
jgi:hypothetical protein